MKSQGVIAPPPLKHETMEVFRKQLEFISEMGETVYKYVRRSEKTLKKNKKYDARLIGRIEELLEELPYDYLIGSNALASSLVPLLTDFYRAGEFNTLKNVQRLAKIMKRRDSAWKALIQYVKNKEKELRNKIGEIYPQSVIDGIVAEHKRTKKPIAKLCREKAKNNDWDEENLRQAVYRRYPKK